MTSWRLLAHFLSFWESDAETPVFRREVALPPIWRQAPVPLVRAVLPGVALCGVAFMVALVRGAQPLATLCLATSLSLVVLLIPSLLVWAVPLGVVLAPVVVGDRERGTWDMLRVTPLSTETILLSKARGALWRLHYGFSALRMTLILASVIPGVASLGLIEHTNRSVGDVPSTLVCGGAMVIIVVGAALFLIDRAQQFVFMILAALAVSASAGSSRMALPGATVAALAAVFAEIGAGIVLLAVLPGSAGVSVQTWFAVLIMFGPMANALANLPFVSAMVGVTLILVGRETAVRLLWRWAVHAAG